MFFKRKAYRKLVDWKNNYADNYAAILEGARRVGKSTIAKTFAEREYRSYILIDFSNASENIKSVFHDISDLNLFFLRLQAETGVTLYPHESLIVFDEVQLFPKARQAIKHLVLDGRYHYLETGSLISINKNVKDILIPSEEMRIPVFPMDYEEFCLATNINYDLIKTVYESKIKIGDVSNRTLMRQMRIYMAVGGMPQAVEAYIQGCDFQRIDVIKREIIRLYEEDFRKIDPSGKISMMYHSIPSQLSNKQFRISTAIKKKKSAKAEVALYDLIDSKTVLSCYRLVDPGVDLSQGKDLFKRKLYLSDTGLFVTLMFIDRKAADNTIYAKLLSDKTNLNLGYLYENLVAQMIAASDRELFYYTWNKEGSTHDYEVDFIFSKNNKIYPVEVKSSGLGKHESILAFSEKYSRYVGASYLVCKKEKGKEQNLNVIPFYLLPLLLEQSDAS